MRKQGNSQRNSFKIERLALVKIGGERIDDEAFHVMGEALELLQIAFGRGRQARPAAVLPAGLRLHQLFAQARLHLVYLLPGRAIGNLDLFGRGADGTGGRHGAQQLHPPEREDDVTVYFQPEVISGLQSKSSPCFFCCAVLLPGNVLDTIDRGKINVLSPKDSIMRSCRGQHDAIRHR